MTQVLSVAALLFAAGWAPAQEAVTVTGRVALENGDRKTNDQEEAQEAVVWLEPLDSMAVAGIRMNGGAGHFRLLQKDKQFHPHLLVVPVGTGIDFPNHDPFFHNVFSLYEGKRFDLGLYESGSSRAVRFDRPGVSYIFCNIHPQMSAVIIALDTPYYAVTKRPGEISIPAVPHGKYMLHVWHEAESPDALAELNREIEVSAAAHDFGTLRLKAGTNPEMGHKNLYGRDYDNPEPPNPVYTR